MIFGLADDAARPRARPFDWVPRHRVEAMIAHVPCRSGSMREVAASLIRAGIASILNAATIRDGSWRPTIFPCPVGSVRSSRRRSDPVRHRLRPGSPFAATGPFPERFYRWLTPATLPPPGEADVASELQRHGFAPTISATLSCPISMPTISLGRTPSEGSGSTVHAPGSTRHARAAGSGASLGGVLPARSGRLPRRVRAFRGSAARSFARRAPSLYGRRRHYRRRSLSPSSCPATAPVIGTSPTTGTASISWSPMPPGPATRSAATCHCHGWTSGLLGHAGRVEIPETASRCGAATGNPAYSGALPRTRRRSRGVSTVSLPALKAIASIWHDSSRLPDTRFIADSVTGWAARSSARRCHDTSAAIAASRFPGLPAPCRTWMRRLDPVAIIPTCEEIFYLAAAGLEIVRSRHRSPRSHALRRWPAKPCLQQVGFAAPGFGGSRRGRRSMPAGSAAGSALSSNSRVSRSRTLIRPDARARNTPPSIPRPSTPSGGATPVVGEELCLWSFVRAGRQVARSYNTTWRHGRLPPMRSRPSIVSAATEIPPDRCRGQSHRQLI